MLEVRLSWWPLKNSPTVSSVLQLSPRFFAVLEHDPVARERVVCDRDDVTRRNLERSSAARNRGRPPKRRRPRRHSRSRTPSRRVRRLDPVAQARYHLGRESELELLDRGMQARFEQEFSRVLADSARGTNPSLGLKLDWIPLKLIPVPAIVRIRHRRAVRQVSFPSVSQPIACRAPTRSP